MTTLVSSNGIKWWTLVLCLLLAACGRGYRLQNTNVGETLFHVADDGHIRMIYQVDHGKVTIHDKDDPRAKRYMEHMRVAQEIRKTREISAADARRKSEARLIKEIEAAPKRDRTTPIYIFVHKPQLGPGLFDGSKEAGSSLKRIQTRLAELMNTDQMISITPLQADVEVYPKGYIKKARTFNIHTRKMNVIKVFHFAVEIQSNYLSADRFKIEETGHWMENEWVIERAAQRVNKVLKETIGLNIPADREKYLSMTAP